MLMGLQLVVRADRKQIEKSLGSLTSECEIFAISEGLFGISIPERTLLTVGEDVVLHKLKHLKHFDLWQGAWQEPKRRRLW